MKTSAEKALDLIVELHELNEECKAQTELIGQHLALCLGDVIDAETGLVSSRYKDEPCLTEWLKPEMVDCDSGHGKCVYFYTQDASSDDCPHCYAALMAIEARRPIKKKRGYVKARITKLAKLEVAYRVDRLKAIGNGQVSEVARSAFEFLGGSYDQ